MLCESCYLAEAVMNVGIHLLCMDCAVDLAWERFITELKIGGNRER